MFRDAMAWKELLKRIRRGELDGATEEEKARGVRQIVDACTAAATIVALQPLPLLDIWLLAPIHVAMVQGIARVRGYRLDKKSVLEILRTIRLSVVAQHATIAAAKLVPGVGWLVAVSAANALTYAIGELSDLYFRTGRSMLPPEMRTALERIYKERFARVYRERQEELRSMFRRGRGGGSGAPSREPLRRQPPN